MLKNVLILLLSKFYSKQESELVGHQAMPSPSNTVITPSIKTECTTWSDAHIGIAPADGYLYVTGRTTNTDGFLQISSDTTEIAATTFGNTDIDIRLLFPLAKGQAMKVTAKSLKSIYLRFSSSIGGGYQALKNALLQGGAICLNSLSSSLRRSSLSARRNGWQSNRQFLRAIQSYSLLLPTEKTITSQCPAQGTPTCAVMVFGLPTLTGAPSLTSGLMRTGISASISTPKRVNSLDMLWGLVPNSLRLISIFTRPKAVSNLVVGGASC